VKDKKREKEISYVSWLIALVLGFYLGVAPGAIIEKAFVFFVCSCAFTFGSTIITWDDREKIRVFEKLIEEALT